MESFHVSAKKQKFYKIEIPEGQPLKTLSWYFQNDGDIFFGIFYDSSLSSSGAISNGKKSSAVKEEKEFDTEAKEMVTPFVKITAKFVHEFDFLDLEKPGTYYILFCNRHSWLHRRNLDSLIQISNPDGSEPKRCFFDGTQASMSEEQSIIKILNLREFKD